MARAQCNGLELEYETSGDPTDPPVVLIIGFTSQLIDWEDEFCELLADEGLFVIRFDNRDAGLSTHLQGEPDMMAIVSGDLSSAPYMLDDMAADVVSLMDALALPAAHVMGISMGGMIAQLVAINHPNRTLSLCSIMSTPGDRAHLAPDPEAAAALVQPAATNAREAADNAVRSARISNSPTHLDEERIAAKARAAYLRDPDPTGSLRQAAAIVAAGDRTEQLRAVTVPTLVMHGAIDPLIVPAGGEATAAAVPNAQLLLIDDMGHELPRKLWPDIVAGVAANTRRTT